MDYESRAAQISCEKAAEIEEVVSRRTGETSQVREQQILLQALPVQQEQSGQLLQEPAQHTYVTVGDPQQGKRVVPYENQRVTLSECMI